MKNDNSQFVIGVLYGGVSSEHQISVDSAHCVIKQLQKMNYKVCSIYIDSKGCWNLKNSKNEQRTNDKNAILQFFEKVDIVFPILYGKYGEDGTIQGFLEIMEKPYIGESVLSSAICADKDMTKRILRSVNISVADDIVVTKVYEHTIEDQIMNSIGLPCYVKPVTQGSSIGITKVYEKSRIRKALDYAFEYDDKVLVEKNIISREFECAVINSEAMLCSEIGEVIVNSEYYSSNIKNIKSSKVHVQIPADVDLRNYEEMKQIAMKTFKALECNCMAKIDLFLTAENKIIVNEVNTMPGFAELSTFPKLWKVSGLPYGELLQILLKGVVERKEKK